MMYQQLEQELLNQIDHWVQGQPLLVLHRKLPLKLVLLRLGLNQKDLLMQEQEWLNRKDLLMQEQEWLSRKDLLMQEQERLSRKDLLMLV
jgi:hypothetical protein